ncbi:MULTISPECIES: WDGH domain-containing protein [Streptomyces]|uniref:WDGH domain-containing protein n=1 Tax=Streptomyces TaxID=1883 RepID=UPI00368467F5
MTTTPDRIPLDDLTSDQLDTLYARIDTLEAVCESNKRAYVGAVRAVWAAEAAAKRLRAAWTAARRRAALYLTSNQNLAASLGNQHAGYLQLAEQYRAAEAQLDTVYRERAHLVAHLAAIHPSHIGPTDPGAPEYAVVTVETPAGQMTWHIAERDLDLFAHVRATLATDPVWDGHTTDEKYEQLRDLTEVEANLPPTT